MKITQSLILLSILAIVSFETIGAVTTYTGVACGTSTQTQSDSFCSAFIPLSCCAKVTNGTKSGSSYSNSTSKYYCLPYDFVNNFRYIDYSSTIRMYYDCPYTTMTPSDSCSSTSDACNTLSTGCCATLTPTANNVTAAYTKSICISKTYAGSIWYNGSYNSNVTVNS